MDGCLVSVLLSCGGHLCAQVEEGPPPARAAGLFSGRPYRPTTDAALLRNRLPSRMYRLTMTVERCPGLPHDVAFLGAGAGRGRGEPGPQAVAGIGRRVFADGRHVVLDRDRDALAGEPLGTDVAVTIDGSEDRAAGDPRRREPGRERPHRARLGVLPVGDGHLAAGTLLVGLGARQRDDDALGNELDVLAVDADELAASEGAGEAQEQQGAVAGALGPVG